MIHAIPTSNYREDLRSINVAVAKNQKWNYIQLPKKEIFPLDSFLCSGSQLHSHSLKKQSRSLETARCLLRGYLTIFFLIMKVHLKERNLSRFYFIPRQNVTHVLLGLWSVIMVFPVSLGNNSKCTFRRTQALLKAQLKFKRVNNNLLI